MCASGPSGQNHPGIHGGPPICSLIHTKGAGGRSGRCPACAPALLRDLHGRSPLPGPSPWPQCTGPSGHSHPATGLPALTTRTVLLSYGPPVFWVLEPSFSSSLLAASGTPHHLPRKTPGNVVTITPRASSDISSLHVLTHSPTCPAPGAAPVLSGAQGPAGRGFLRDSLKGSTRFGWRDISPPIQPNGDKGCGPGGWPAGHARSPGESRARFTLRTSCLHFSTLSCNFLSCSGLRDGSALLLVSRDVASFSSLHAAW